MIAINQRLNESPASPAYSEDATTVMTTTASSYKGARTKSALVALLKERDFLEDTSEPLAKMTVKALVELLVHGDNHPRAQVVDAMAAAVDTNDTDEDDEEQDEDEGLDEDLNSLIGNRDHYRLGYGGQWTLETCVPCSCPPGPGVPTAVFGSTAIPTPALIEFILPLVTADSAVKSSVLKAALSSVMLRTPNASLIQHIRSGAGASIREGDRSRARTVRKG